MKSIARRLLRPLGYDLIKRPTNPQNERLRALAASLRELRELAPRGQDRHAEFLKFCAANLHDSRSQLMQDLFVLFHLGQKRDGFFVEFGATDGVALSNTHLHEHAYGWTGILAEPALCWHEQLRNNRACSIDMRCVWSKSGERLDFNETNDRELSTIDAFSSLDLHAGRRTQGKSYTVETVSLNDLLAQHSAPAEIDYLSIDTEGSEFDILNSFDFGRHSFGVISVEHNFVTEARDNILRLLTSHGYHRMFQEFSEFDDWYVRRPLA